MSRKQKKEIFGIFAHDVVHFKRLSIGRRVRVVFTAIFFFLMGSMFLTVFIASMWIFVATFIIIIQHCIFSSEMKKRPPTDPFADEKRKEKEEEEEEKKDDDTYVEALKDEETILERNREASMLELTKEDLKQMTAVEESTGLMAGDSTESIETIKPVKTDKPSKSSSNGDDDDE